MSSTTATIEARIGALRLIQGDAFAILPALPPAECVIADPWFEEPTLAARARARRLVEAIVLLAPVCCVASQASWAAHWADVYPEGFRLFVSCDPFVGAHMDTAQPFIVWGHPRVAHKPRRPHFHIQAADERPALEALGHPSLRPVALMESLIETFTHPGELVIDPFMGVGALAVACQRLGRRYIGIERDPDYFATTVRRVGG